MEENNEENCSSNGSAISENTEFSKLNINNSNKSDEKNDSTQKVNNYNYKDINYKDEEENLKTYKSMFSFSIIQKNEDNNSDFEEKQQNSNLIDNKSPQLDIRTSDNNNKISIWETIKQQISNFKNQLVFNYNIFSGLHNLILSAPGLPKEIQIFEEKYSKQDDNLINRLKNIPWFSYRKDFNQIKEKDKIYTSDAGWGCMLRASQMILAQGIYRLFSIENLETFINEFIAYFYDNKIPIKLLNKSKDDNNLNNEKNIKEKKNINNNNEDEIYDDFLIVDVTKECRMSFIDISMEMIKGLENMSDRNASQKYITSPFSIRNFIKMQNIISPNGKKAGEWFSNYDTTKLIYEINKQMNENNDNDFKILNFDDGTIFIEDIINKCFKEEDNFKNVYGFENISYNNFEKSEVLFNENHINKDLKSNIYIFNKRRFEFKHKFILFISVRHGLYELDKDLYDDILNIFDIKTNIGFIGGKSSRAFYFIGRCDKNLIFLDPHFVQPTIPLNKFGTDSIHESYRPENIYYMPISELSPSFSIGFAVKDMKSFKLFMEKMNSQDYFIKQTKLNGSSIISKKINLFAVKNWHFPIKDGDDSNQDISNNINVEDNFF